MTNTIASTIELVARGAIESDWVRAREFLANLNLEDVVHERQQLLSKIWSQSRPPIIRQSIRAKRTSVPRRVMLKVYRRDRFTCRYAHCQRQTIYIPVLKELSRLFPDVLSYHPNWKPVGDHLLYWVYGTSIEHKLSFPHGGDSSETNLITACYCCNDAKTYLHLDDLGWEITEPADSSWDGLESLLAALTSVEAPKELQAEQ